MARFKLVLKTRPVWLLVVAVTAKRAGKLVVQVFDDAS